MRRHKHKKRLRMLCSVSSSSSWISKKARKNNCYHSAATILFRTQKELLWWLRIIISYNFESDKSWNDLSWLRSWNLVSSIQEILCCEKTWWIKRWLDDFHWHSPECWDIVPFWDNQEFLGIRVMLEKKSNWFLYLEWRGEVMHILPEKVRLYRDFVYFYRELRAIYRQAIAINTWSSSLSLIAIGVHWVKLIGNGGSGSKPLPHQWSFGRNNHFCKQSEHETWLLIP